jgi:hypothetical protein
MRPPQPRPEDHKAPPGEAESARARGTQRPFQPMVPASQPAARLCRAAWDSRHAPCAYRNLTQRVHRRFAPARPSHSSRGSPRPPPLDAPRPGGRAAMRSINPCAGCHRASSLGLQVIAGLVCSATIYCHFHELFGGSFSSLASPSPSSSRRSELISVPFSGTRRALHWGAFKSCASTAEPTR